MGSKTNPFNLTVKNRQSCTPPMNKMSPPKKNEIAYKPPRIKALRDLNRSVRLVSDYVGSECDRVGPSYDKQNSGGVIK